MKSNSSNPPATLGPGKRWAFRMLTLSVLILVGLYAAETILRWHQASIAGSDKMDPGMVQYDPDTGWRLKPGWTGHHRHKDYSATYSINALGLRNDAPVVVGLKGNQLNLVVGDSFSFGLGVNDDATFVHHLNEARPAGVSYSNASIPGFSTDQEALLIEKRLLALRPARIVLVVYLGNDLFDNQLAYPLQVSSAKPFFERQDDKLVLSNSPVPMVRKPEDGSQGGLVAAVWGPDMSRWPWRARWEQNSELFRLVSQFLLPAGEHHNDFNRRFTPALQLFDQLLGRIANDCLSHQVDLTVVTLAGRSFVENPGSVSAQYQEVFRQGVVAAAQHNQLGVIDVAALMKSRYQRDKVPWYYPNEGHLNPAGHQVVAELLRAELAKGK